MINPILDNAGTGITECDVVDKLNEFYRAQKDFRGQSFDTISSSGPTGSIIHYKPKPGSDRKIEKCMFLLDAGAHYTCGTTDTTRTVHCGEPSDFEKECYTRVLMGHINLAKLRFPEGTRGPALDVLTRQPLWEAGLQFNHGTGHGIGCWLNVHEPPTGLYLSPRLEIDLFSHSFIFQDWIVSLSLLISSTLKDTALPTSPDSTKMASSVSELKTPFMSLMSRLNTTYLKAPNS